MSLFGNLQPSSLHRVRAQSDLMNEDPSTWTGDWRKCPDGRYLTGDGQKIANALLSTHERAIVGMAIRNVANGTIGAVFGVSREAVAKRLRPLALNSTRGRRAPSTKTLPA